MLLATAQRASRGQRCLTLAVGHSSHSKIQAAENLERMQLLSCCAVAKMYLFIGN